MSGVDFDNTESSLPCSLSCRLERVNDLLNAFDSKRLRHWVVFCEWDNAGCYDFAPASLSVRQHPTTFPWAVGAGFTSGVSELHAGDAALLVKKTSDTGQFIDVFVLPDAEILR